jgi:hypothetical protein
MNMWIRLACLLPVFASLPAFAAPVAQQVSPGGGPKPPVVGPAGCTEDSYEPDSWAAPWALVSGTYSDLSLCAGNDDHWRIDVRPGMHVLIRTEFNHAIGDVDITLHRMDNSQIDISDGVTNVEELRYTATAEESLLLRVYGYAGVTNSYSLTLDIDDFSAGCTTDTLEPNNGFDTAATAPPGVNESRICLGDMDFYAIDLAPGEGFDFGIDFESAIGELALSLYSEVDRLTPLQIIRTSGDTATLTLDSSAAGGRYYVRVYSPTGRFNGYSYSVARYAPGEGQTGTVSGRAQYEDQLRGADIVIGASPTRWLPVRNVPVELVRATDGRVVATTYTDEAGAYSMAYRHRAGGDLFLRVAARIEAPGYTMRVLPTETDRAAYIATSPMLSALATDASGNTVSDFSFAAAGPLGGAFNIVDRSLDAFRFIDTYTTMTDLDLSIIWSRGQPHECTSCYDGGTIYLGGGFEDPDEYDDSVILHEFGHFFSHQLSHDDSPGGNHNGDRTNPLVAWGEGVASIFAMMVEESAIYVDTMSSGGLFQDFERARWPEVRGTSTGLATGQISEYLVVALIWDIYDGTGEAHDSVATGPESIMRVLLDYLPGSAMRNQGVQGTDLADFVQGFLELYPDEGSGMTRLLSFYEFPGGGLVMSSPVGSQAGPK